MHKTFIATALALGMCLPVYAEQFSNSNSDSMLSPVTVDEPNTAVPHREKLDTEKQQGLPIRLTGEHAEYDTGQYQGIAERSGYLYNAGQG